MSFQRDYLQDGSGDEVVKMNPDKVSLSLMYGGCMVTPSLMQRTFSLRLHHRFGGSRIKILTFGYVAGVKDAVL